MSDATTGGGPTCPPHHWLVTVENTAAAGRVYRHTCRRCGLVKDQPINPPGRRWPQKPVPGKGVRK